MLTLLNLRLGLEFQIAIRWKAIKRFIRSAFRFSELLAA